VRQCSQSALLLGAAHPCGRGHRLLAWPEVTTATTPLGAFLRARREALTPGRAGVAVSGVRRTPGLRREEVATLAGISADYYVRLEQGRERTPSVQVLDALAGALQLDVDETAYLVGLAQARPVRRRRRTDRVPDGTLALLDTIGSPAFVENRYLDVLAANPLAAALSPNMRPGVNRMLAAFLDPDEQRLHDNWEQATANAVGQLRAAAGADIDDRLVALIGELSLRSERFRQLWAKQEVIGPAGAAVLLRHPAVGDLHLFREKLDIAGSAGQTLVIYHAERGTASADALALLGGLAASNPVQEHRRTQQDRTTG
jgi:transcriptional regulator with XRE-family HTH domain